MSDSAEPRALPDGALEGVVLSGGYEIGEKLGKGGMAWVYAATREDKLCALKILFSHMADDAEFKARFLREARIQQQLDHPNIVGVTDFVEERGLVGFVLEYCNGGTLLDLLKQLRGPMPLWQIRDLFLPLIDSMAYAHDAGVIHRDLKPPNILLHHQDDKIIPKLTDFGIAKLFGDATLTQTGTMIGTLLYMSPEQVEESKYVDMRADIYSLGVLLYQLISGTLPFIGKSSALMMQILNDQPPPPPRAPRPIRDVVMCCLAKSPDDRYQTCRELYKAVEDALHACANEDFTCSDELPAAPPIEPPTMSLQGTSGARPGGNDTIDDLDAVAEAHTLQLETGDLASVKEQLLLASQADSASAPKIGSDTIDESLLGDDAPDADAQIQLAQLPTPQMPMLPRPTALAGPDQVSSETAETPFVAAPEKDAPELALPLLAQAADGAVAGTAEDEGGAAAESEDDAATIEVAITGFREALADLEARGGVAEMPLAMLEGGQAQETPSHVSGVHHEFVDASIFDDVEVDSGNSAELRQTMLLSLVAFGLLATILGLWLGRGEQFFGTEPSTLHRAAVPRPRSLRLRVKPRPRSRKSIIKVRKRPLIRRPQKRLDFGMSRTKVPGIRPLGLDDSLAALQQRCESGDGPSCRHWGLLLSRSSLLSDQHKALRTMGHACDLRDLRACVVLGQWYYKGMLGTLVSIPKARHAWMRACRLGARAICFRLGQLWHEQQKLPQACRLYRRACLKQHGPGCLWQGWCVLERRKRLKVKKRRRRRRRRWRRRLRRLRRLRNSYLRQARRLFRSACDLRTGDGCNRLGVMYNDGTFGKPNEEKARGLFRRACALRSAHGCFNTGLYALSGRGGLPSPGLARGALDQACALGDGPACYLLGTMLYREHRKKTSQEQAVRLFVEACRYKLAQGCYHAGYLMARGKLGVPSCALASPWLAQACRLGFRPCRRCGKRRRLPRPPPLPAPVVRWRAMSLPR